MPGSSALVVPVPEADGLLTSTRTADALRDGVPAHITILFPFVHPEEVDDDVVAAISDVVSRRRAFPFVLAGTARFPGLLYLAPEPAAPFAAMTNALVRRFPHHPPYGGAHRLVVPHVTVAAGEPAELERAEAAVRPRLPIAAVAREVLLLVDAGGATPRWHAAARFPLR